MSPFTSEEGVTSQYVKNEAPDVIINIVDATNLGRSLFFTTQLLELGIPMVVALNKSDINKKKETVIDTKALSRRLGCPVVSTVSSSVHQEGLSQLVKVAVSLKGRQQAAPYRENAAEVTDLQSSRDADRKRFAFVKEIVSDVERRAVKTRERTVHDKIDAVLTNRWAGIPIFAVVMFLVFQISQAWLGTWIAEGVEIGSVSIPGLVTLIDAFKEWVSGLLEDAQVNVFLSSLLTEGIIGGVSAVVGFLPLVMVMYFLIALLEDCGYMARVSVVLDPIFKKVGLSGKSVIPFVVGTGCAIPGVMACRTIHNERERRATAMLAPFMPCGAKLPVIALFAGAFFGDTPWVGTLMYFAGILIILLGAVIINGITGTKGKKTYFIIELPDYKAPSFAGAVKSMLSRGWSYIVKAGTVILLCNAVVYVMQSFTWSFSPVAEGAPETSILATVAGPISVLLIPIGVHAWQMAAAAVTGFIAKENVVGTLAVCYGISNLIDTEELAMVEGAGADVAAIFGITKVAALAYLMFNLFSPPCFAAIGAMNSEMQSAKWFWGGIGLQLFMGYSVAYLVYTVGTLITDAKSLDVTAAVAGLAAVLVMCAMLLAVGIINNKKAVK